MSITPAAALRERAAAIRLLVLDVDGVLTDGALYLSSSGEESKAFHVRDGQGMVMWLGSGGKIAIISGRKSPAVAERMAELGVTQVYQGQGDKAAAMRELLEHYALEPAQAAFVGDDLPDIPAMDSAGLGIAVADASDRVRGHADYVTACSGGRGAVREVCELLLAAQGLLEEAENRLTGARV